MADNFSSSSNQTSIRRKKRSASICAPGSSSMEQILVPFSKDVKKKDNDSITPESVTPKRRPATRSQSARASGANKSVKKKNPSMNQGTINCKYFFFFWDKFSNNSELL